MANAIELFKQYIAMLDEIYKLEAKTNVLDGANELVRQGANANELVIPMIDMDGLANYSRSSGYVNGSVDFNFETVKCKFVRTKVIPELDAFRISKYASLTDISTVEAADLATGADVVKALRAATTKMNNDEVPEANRVLFIETGLKGLVDDLDTTKSKEVLTKFSQIVEMPQNRFYTGIKQLSGGSSEEKGGYTRATGANNINFMVVEKSAAIQFAKRVNSKIISPEQNQDADAYKYGYRQVAIADAYKNKRAGIYLHKSTVTA